MNTKLHSIVISTLICWCLFLIASEILQNSSPMFDDTLMYGISSDYQLPRINVGYCTGTMQCKNLACDIWNNTSSGHIVIDPISNNVNCQSTFYYSLEKHSKLVFGIGYSFIVCILRSVVVVIATKSPAGVAGMTCFEKVWYIIFASCLLVSANSSINILTVALVITTSLYDMVHVMFCWTK